MRTLPVSVCASSHHALAASPASVALRWARANFSWRVGVRAASASRAFPHRWFSHSLRPRELSTVALLRQPCRGARRIPGCVDRLARVRLHTRALLLSPLLERGLCRHKHQRTCRDRRVFFKCLPPLSVRLVTLKIHRDTQFTQKKLSRGKHCFQSWLAAGETSKRKERGQGRGQ